MKNALRRACARIAEHEFWLVWVFGAPLLFASNVPAWVFGAALATIPFFWLARKIARGHWSYPTPLDVPLVILLGLGVVAVAVSNQRSVSLLLYGMLFGSIALYYGVVNGLAHASIDKGVWLVLALGLSMALVGLLGMNPAAKFFPAARLYDVLPRVNLDFLNARGFTPNIVAGAVAPVVPLAFALALARAGGARVLAMCVACVMLLVVFVTQSRGAWLGLACGFAVLGAWRFARVRWMLLLLVPVSIVSLAWLGPQTLTEILLAGDAGGSSVSRAELWNRALLMLRDFPFTGIGLGTFETNVQIFYPLFQNLPGVPVPHAHNMYLQMGVDFGVGGVVAFVGLVITVLLSGLDVLRAPARETRNWVGAGLVAGYVVYLAHGMLDAVAVSSKVSVVIWLMLALMMILWRDDFAARANEATS